MIVELNIGIGDETLGELIKLCAASLQMEGNDTPLVRFSALVLGEMGKYAQQIGMETYQPETVYVSPQILKGYSQ